MEEVYIDIDIIITMKPKERIKATINGQSYDRVAVTPIFMAWAAHFIGRTYRDYYLDGEVLVEAQMAVVKAFGIDQISAISDPWREASAYGMEFNYPEQGVGHPKGVLINLHDDLKKLKPLEIAASGRMQQRVDSVASMTGRVGDTHSVLGWVEGPIAEYSDLRGVEQTMVDLIDCPDIYCEAAEIIVRNEIDFARAQIRAGADMIGVGDAVASLLGPDMYKSYVLPFEKRLIDAIHDAGAMVKLHICGDINPIIHLVAESGADVIDLDWMVPLEKAREIVGEDITLCGNINPAGVMLQGTVQDVADAARECIAKGGDRFILMPGCEVPPDTPEDNIRALFTD